MERICTISIVVEDREKNAATVNNLLSEYGRYITARLGLPRHRKGISIITVVLDADNDTIGSLTGKLGQIEGLHVKSITI